MRSHYRAGRIVKLKIEIENLIGLGPAADRFLIELALESSGEGAASIERGTTFSDRLLARIILAGLPEPRKSAAADTLMRAVDLPLRRRAAIEVLGMLGDRRAVPRLVKLLPAPRGSREEGSLGVRLAAAQSLGAIGDPAAVKSVIRALLSDEETTARLTAVRDVLGRIGGPRAVKALIGALGDESAIIQGVAAEKLGELKAREAAPALRKVLARPGWPRKDAALSALAALDAPPDELIRECGRVLEGTNLAAALEAVRILEDSVKRGEKGAGPVLAASLGHKSPLVRKRAALALSDFPAPDAVPGLKKILAKDGPPHDPEVRLAAAYALFRLEKDDRRLKVLKDGLEHAERPVRLRAALLLGRTRSKKAVPALEELAADESDKALALIARRSASLASGEAEKRVFPKGVEAAKLAASRVRNLVAAMPDEAFRPAYLASLSPIPVLRPDTAGPARVRADLTAFIDDNVLAQLGKSADDPIRGLDALRSLLLGVYDHADQALGGFDGDDLIVGRSRQEALGRAVLDVVGLFSPRYAAAATISKEGGSVALESGAGLEFAAGALASPVPIILIGPHEEEPAGVWAYFPSGLSFKGPVILTIRQKYRPEMIRELAGPAGLKLIEKGGPKIRLSLDGFW